jgi:hypothetical protein
VCDDGLYCSINDQCNAGICSGTSRNCSDNIYYIDTIENQTTEMDAKNDTNTTLEILTLNNVTNASIDIIKYYGNPKSPIFGIFELNKFIEIVASPELEGNLSWVIIKIYYTDSEVDSLGIDENSLRIYYYNQTYGNWTPFNPPYGDVNTTGDYIWANTTHFSYYGSGGLLADNQSCNSSSECSSGYCVHGICRSSSTYCGDGACNGAETCSLCSQDCGACQTTTTPSNTGGGGGVGGTPPTTTTTTIPVNVTATTIQATTTTTMPREAVTTTTVPGVAGPTGLVTASPTNIVIGGIVVVILILIGIMYWKKKWIFRK